MKLYQAVVVSCVIIAAAGVPAHARFTDSLYIPDIETFMQIGGNSSPQVSVDGKVFCFTSNQSGVTQVYRLTGSGWPDQLTYFPDGISFYNLTRDGKWIVAGAAWGGSEETNLHLVEVATGRTEPLTDIHDVQIADPIWSDDASKI